MEIGNFQGVKIFLEKIEDSNLFLNCYFNERELKLKINGSNVDILESNMEKAQSYYISNSIKDMYNELITNIQRIKNVREFKTANEWELSSKLMDRNYDIVAVLRSDLTVENMSFMTQKIEELKQKLDIIQDGNTFYRQRKGKYDDFGPGVNFFLKLKQYSEYFELLEYNSYLEGVLHGTV